MSKSYQEKKIQLLGLIQDRIFSINSCLPHGQEEIYNLQGQYQIVSNDSYAEKEIDNLLFEFKEQKLAS